MCVCMLKIQKGHYVRGELDYISDHQANTLDTDLNKI